MIKLSMSEKNKQHCAISGKIAAELPFGMDEEHPDCIALKLKISEKITQISAKGLTEFYSNCEYGVPMWAAEIIAGMREFNQNVMIHLVIPYENQAARRSGELREKILFI